MAFFHTAQPPRPKPSAPKSNPSPATAISHIGTELLCSSS
ncbi:8492_t:CDS:1 [Racocetra persica]|uniref:8492_t:CDS:1 n=1 Tax=Racocetra persica TaxID=160502 RepID=A0ACA9S2G4_9GLOM|nr:8492_t:CDS:1 [Racocetra persica]